MCLHHRVLVQPRKGLNLHQYHNLGQPLQMATTSQHLSRDLHLQLWQPLLLLQGRSLVQVLPKRLHKLRQMMQQMEQVTHHS